MLYPSLRGGNQNPGVQEKFFGEVDDVVSAADFLAHQPYVDPSRIYLGGHSTGGTLALLVSEYSDRFRSVFYFGPVSDVTGYGPNIMEIPFDRADDKEVALRAPGRWLRSVKSPTFVFEGAKMPSNANSVLAMLRQPLSPALRFYLVDGVNHFSILQPANRLIAAKILQDNGSAPTIGFLDEDLAAIGRR